MSAIDYNIAIINTTFSLKNMSAGKATKLKIKPKKMITFKKREGDEQKKINYIT